MKIAAIFIRRACLIVLTATAQIHPAFTRPSRTFGVGGVCRSCVQDPGDRSGSGHSDALVCHPPAWRVAGVDLPAGRFRSGRSSTPTAGYAMCR